MSKDRNIAICLAAGKGKRMNSDTAKQYMSIGDKPVLYYCLKAFEDSFIDGVVIVTAKDDIEYVRREIVNKYKLSKVTAIVEGGKERYHSVMCGLNAIDECDYVFIHDGARPFINNEILERAYDTVKKYKTAIVAMPVKDTIKIVNADGCAVETPDRSTVYMMQTPQVFSYKEIKEAYMEMIDKEDELLNRGVKITDDAMVMEEMGNLKVHVSEGDYRNIKITTPEDIVVAEAFLSAQN